jgi:hypothetical protein
MPGVKRERERGRETERDRDIDRSMHFIYETGITQSAPAAPSYSFDRIRSYLFHAFATCVSWLNRLCCRPSASKFCGASHCSYARFIAGQSESSIAYIAVFLDTESRTRYQTSLLCTASQYLGLHACGAGLHAPGALFRWGLDDLVVSQHPFELKTEALGGNTAVIVECIAAPLHPPVAELVEGAPQ